MRRSTSSRPVVASVVPRRAADRGRMPSVMRFGLGRTLSPSCSPPRPLTPSTVRSPGGSSSRARRGGQEKLAFVTTDPQFLFPTAGGPDDPAAGTGGLTIELFSQQHARQRLTSRRRRVGDPHDSAGVPTSTRTEVAPAGPTPASRAIVLKSGRVFQRAGLRDRAIDARTRSARSRCGSPSAASGRARCFDAATVNATPAARVFVARRRDARALRRTARRCCRTDLRRRRLQRRSAAGPARRRQNAARDLATCECIDSCAAMRRHWTRPATAMGPDGPTSAETPKFGFIRRSKLPAAFRPWLPRLLAHRPRAVASCPSGTQQATTTAYLDPDPGTFISWYECTELHVSPCCHGLGVCKSCRTANSATDPVGYHLARGAERLSVDGTCSNRFVDDRTTTCKFAFPARGGSSSSEIRRRAGAGSAAPKP